MFHATRVKYLQVIGTLKVILTQLPPTWAPLPPRAPDEGPSPFTCTLLRHGTTQSDEGSMTWYFSRESKGPSKVHSGGKNW
jgi:hypothetical protein